MKKNIAALLAGILFGLGVSVAQMIDPARVVGFLNLAGAWDPTLALVMIGALVVNVPATQWLLRTRQPLFERGYQLPDRRSLDWRLIVGAVLFGAGWGVAGYCPAPALSSLSFADAAIVTLLAAYLAGTAVTRWLLAGEGLGASRLREQK